jgi:hypothetical protein
MSATISGTVWWLENPLTEVTGKEEAVGLTRPEGVEEAQLRDAAILGFVNDSQVERHVVAGCKLRGESTEQPRVSDEALGIQLGADASKHRPEHGTLRLRQSGFSA